MAVYSYISYAPSAISFSGSTVSLSAGYDPDTDRVNIEVDDEASGNSPPVAAGTPDARFDEGTQFDGDRRTNESGDDTTQDGTVTELDGTLIDSGRIYLEQGFTLTATGQPTITLYRVEISGRLVGYITSEPLAEGVTYSQSQFNITAGNSPDSSDPDAIVDVPCFVAGTRIETPNGAVSIEDICAGDTVICADGEMATVVWTGARCVLPAFLTESNLWPIEIAADAFGPGVPTRSLLVSPNHRILVSGALCEMLFGETEVLVPAKFLIHWPGVSERRSDGPVTYCHFLCDRHRIVRANGVPSESLHPGDIALGAFHTEAREEVLNLFPELAEVGVTAYGPTAAPVLRRSEATVLVSALSTGP